GILADDAPRPLALEAVPDDARLALVLEDLVLVDADAGLLDGHPREHLGVVVDVLADAADDGVDLLLGERLVERLGSAGASNQLLHLRVRGRRRLLRADPGGRGSGHGAHGVPS